MSIINDALKKAQKSLTKTKKTIPEEPKNTPPKTFDGASISNVYEKLHKPQDGTGKNIPGNARKNAADVVHMSPQRKPAFHWVKSAVVIIFYLACIAGGLFLASRYVPLDNVRAFFQKSKQKSRYPSPPPPVKKRQYKPGELVLNGTSIIDGKKVALINDEIYEMGELVNGMSIVSIGLDKVELSDDQKITTLRVH